MKKNDDGTPSDKKLSWNKESLKLLQDSMLEQVAGGGTNVCNHAGYTTWSTSCGRPDY